MTDDDRLLRARGWVFDVDGCLMRTARAGGAGGTPFPGAVELVAELKSAGRQIVLCTNASARPPARYAAHLRDLGFDITDDEFVTAGSAAADHVAVHHAGATVLALGGDGVTVPMSDAGIALVGPIDGTAADVVVIGAGDAYTAAELNAACLAVDAGAPLYVTVRTPWFHGGLGKSVSVSSAIAAAVSWVTGVEAEVTGKPSAALARRLLARFDAVDGAARDLVVVGDHTAEMELAGAMGACSVLVLSGALTAEAAAALPSGSSPDLVFPDVGAVHDAVTAHLVQAPVTSPQH